MGVTILQQYPVPENKNGPQIIDQLTKRILALGATQSGQFLVDCETYMSLPQMCEFIGSQKTVHILHNSEQPASVFSILESGQKTLHLTADGLFDLLMMKLSNHYTSKKQTKIESKGPRFELDDFCIKIGSVTMNQTFKGILVELKHIESSKVFTEMLLQVKQRAVIGSIASKMVISMLTAVRVKEGPKSFEDAELEALLDEDPCQTQEELASALRVTKQNKVEYRPCILPSTVWALMREFLQGFLGSCAPVQPPSQLLAKMNDVYQPMDTIYQYLEHFSAYRKTTGMR